MKRWFFVFLMVLISVTGCANSGSGSSSLPPSIATPPPSTATPPPSTATPHPTNASSQSIEATVAAMGHTMDVEALTATPRSQQVSDLIEMPTRHDDFSDPSSRNWPVGSLDYGPAAIEAGHYTLTITVTKTFAWVTPGTDSYAFDSRIEVDAHDHNSALAGYYGVFCRYENKVPKHKRLYLFTTDNQNYFSIDRYDSTADPTWTNLAYIKVPVNTESATTTRLRADCIGNVLKFYRNDERMLSAQDDVISAGSNGLVIGATKYKDVSVDFDNYAFTEYARGTR